MPKSLLYVPGLAQPELVVNQAKTKQEFLAKVDAAFRSNMEVKEMPDGREFVTYKPDNYISKMVRTIEQKGAVPTDCGQYLHWILLPEPPVTQKAFRTLGNVSGNVLARTLPETAPIHHSHHRWLIIPNGGKMPEPMPLAVKGASASTFTPCSAPEYLGQPLPSTALFRTKALAGVAKNDTLYIIGHCNAQGGSLSYKCPAVGHNIKTKKSPNGCGGSSHCEKRFIDPVTLATLLINEGLPPKIPFDIALVACYSGGLEDDSLQTVQCFGQRLAGSLSARGYRCRVYGATGLTSSENGVFQVAREAQWQFDGKIHLNEALKVSETDEPDEDAPAVDPRQPFYKRFFRFYN
jgi:hypothetical protein